MCACAYNKTFKKMLQKSHVAYLGHFFNAPFECTNTRKCTIHEVSFFCGVSYVPHGRPNFNLIDLQLHHWPIGHLKLSMDLHQTYLKRRI